MQYLGGVVKVKTKTRRIAILGVFCALSLVLSFVESLLPPITAALPGIKMGLSNIVTVFLLYRLGGRDAAVVNILRVMLSALLFGNVETAIFSLAGAVLSTAAMILMMRYTDFSRVSVSVVGGVIHNMGQIAVACVLTDTAEIAYYLPILVISGCVAGVLVGLAAWALESRVPSLGI